MEKKIKTHDIVLAALLSALSYIIAAWMPTLPVPQPFTMTLGSHVPTMISLFINPVVAIFTTIGSCFGFLQKTGNIIVVTRAAFHILFVIVGWYMIKKKLCNIFFAIIVTALVHSIAEAAISYFLTPIFMPGSVAGVAAGIAFTGTMVQHFVDTAITAPVLYALTRAHLIKNTGIKWKVNRKISA